MSAIAGRVLILPKGEYDASVTYEFLDLINYGGRSWIAKKASVGIEPTDENSEYWQPFGSSIIPDGVTVEINENGEISVVDSPKLGGKDASEYFTTDGGTVNGNIKLKKSDTSEVAYLLENADRLAKLSIINGQLGLYDYTNVKWIFASEKNGGTTFNGQLSTKPTGTYTGNGSSSARTINIGGIGEGLLVWSTSDVATVALVGKTCWLGGVAGSGSECENTGRLDADNNMRLYTVHKALNAEGVTYNYRLL